MAHKYVIHGAPYCGDGTASNAITDPGDAGTAGAWNDLWSIIEGTAPAYGSIAAGDIIHIRALDYSAGALSKSYSTTQALGNTAGTATAPVTWLLDDGTEWSGVTGTLEMTNTYTSSTRFAVQNYNSFMANTNHTWKIIATATNPIDKAVFGGLGAHMKGLYFDDSAKTGAYGSYYGFSSCIVEDCYFKIGNPGTSGSNCVFIPSQSAMCARFINLQIELTYTGSVVGCNLFGGYGYGTQWEVYGGRIFGSGSSNGMSLVTSGSTTIMTSFRSVGFAFPKNMKLTKNDALAGLGKAEALGCDGLQGGLYAGSWGRASSRIDESFPYLNAAVPDSTNTGWSWKIWPNNVSYAYQAIPLIPGVMGYTDTAGAKTIKVELLVAETMSPTLDNLWVNLTYIGTDDVPVTLTSRVIGSTTAHTPSDATWTGSVFGDQMSYGPTKFDKYKILLTTPSSIKQDTLITLTFLTTLQSADSDEVIFLDPAFQLSTPV